METPRDDRLAEDLRALRPTPRPEFAAELDERAAAGFPRRSRLPHFSFDRLRSTSPRRLLLPAGGVAVIAITIATVVVGISGTSEENGRQTVQAVAPSPEDASSSRPPRRLKQFSAPVESAEPLRAIERASGGVATSGAASDAASNPNFDGSGRFVPGSAEFAGKPGPRNRAVERSAQIVLGAEPADVAEDSARVLEAVHAHDGIVMRSSTRQGKAGAAGARFELLIPSAKLGDALAAISEIDEVRSRHEATADITAPTVQVGELLQDSKARIDSLLGQLQEAETESEREAVEAELRQERRHRARLRASLQDLQRRAEFSRVLVRIETGAAEELSDGGAWGISDALDDAGKILAVAAAVTVVALAILGPIALIALLAWLAHRAWVRRERRRVLS
ncbi:MAG TPA: DUF4349 domain-containing protein [Solirubrobacterales bacterium]